MGMRRLRKALKKNPIDRRPIALPVHYCETSRFANLTVWQELRHHAASLAKQQ